MPQLWTLSQALQRLLKWHEKQNLTAGGKDTRQKTDPASLVQFAARAPSKDEIQLSPKLNRNLDRDGPGGSAVARIPQSWENSSIS